MQVNPYIWKERETVAVCERGKGWKIKSKKIKWNVGREIENKISNLLCCDPHYTSYNYLIINFSFFFSCYFVWWKFVHK